MIKIFPEKDWMNSFETKHYGFYVLEDVSPVKYGVISDTHVYFRGSKLPLFSYRRDGHQPASRGLDTHEKKRKDSL